MKKIFRQTPPKSNRLISDKNNRIAVVFWLAFFILFISFSSCEDFYKKNLEIDSAESGRKLVVTAAMEDDLFYIYLSLSQPITSKPLQIPERIEDAVVRLYEENQLVFEITQQDKYPGYEPYEPYYVNAIPYAVRENIKVIPGKKYRLEVSYQDYPLITSTVTAPERLSITNAFLDTSSFIERDPDGYAYVDMSGSYQPTCPKFLQMRMNIDNNPDQKDYYLIEAFEVSDENTTILDLYESAFRLSVATTDRILIQDNPDVVAEEWMSDPEKNTFVFPQMMLTDLTFQGGKNQLEILLSTCSLRFNDNSCEYYAKAGISEDRIKRTTYRLIALVKHICPESFDYYRTFALQRKGLGFFAEPVNIISNINGGYGCFSVSTTSRLVLSEYNICELKY